MRALGLRLKLGPADSPWGVSVRTGMEEQCGGTDGEKGPCPSVPGVVIEVRERWEHPKEALPDNLLYDLQGGPHPLEYLPSHGVQELMSQSSSHHKP